MVFPVSKFKIFPLVVLTALLSSILSCGEHQHQNGSHQPGDVTEIKVPRLFLAYIDSVTRVPLKKFNETSLIAFDDKFSNRLPLTMHDPSRVDNGKNILMQVYRHDNAIDSIQAGAIFLLPKVISEALSVEDFTRYFGKIKAEKPLIGVTAQPLPVQIDVFPGTSLKLTYNDHANLAEAKVVTVEVLKSK